jgi:hypothetical protein
MLFQYKGIWKFRFILSDRSGKELLAMASSWSNLKYHYDVSVAELVMGSDHSAWCHRTLYQGECHRYCTMGEQLVSGAECQRMNQES